MKSPTDAELLELAAHLGPSGLSDLRRRLDLLISKFLGTVKPASAAERQAITRYYRGQAEPCCNCGKEYPRAWLIMDGTIYCTACQVEANPYEP